MPLEMDLLCPARMRRVTVGSAWLVGATIVLHAAVAWAQQLIAGGAHLLLPGVLYYLATGGLIAAYAAVVRRVGEAPSRGTWLALILVPLAIQAVWFFALPVLAIDAYSYLADAAHIYAGLNPYQHPVSEAAGSAFGRSLAEYGWRPAHGISPYGPVWMNIVSAVGPVAGDVEAGVRVLKLVAVGAAGIAAWLICRTVEPALRARAFTTFWWNPVVIIEGAGEAHNEAVMIVLVVLSLWCVRRNAVAGAAGALAAAVLTKWIPAFFGPAYLLYLWRRRLLTPRTILLSTLVVAGIAVLAYWPFWIGADTFAGIQSLPRPRFIASSTGVFIRLLGYDLEAAQILRTVAAVVLGVASVHAAVVSRTDTQLIRACAATALVYVLLASPMYWAWYVMLPIALLALLDDLALVLVLTTVSRVVAPFDLMRLEGWFSWANEVWATTIIALWLPLAYIGWRALTTRGRRTRASRYAPSPAPLP